jgi:hypothetical protein
LGNCDGIVWNGLDTWYVSVWTGQKVMKFDANFAAGPILVANALSSPADIDYNLEGDTLAVPNSGNNTLTFIGFSPIVNVNCNLLPLQVLENEISFSGSSISFGDSLVRVPLLNNSGLGFAYPLARMRITGNLPSGMTFGNNQNGFNVFASAWNPDSLAVAEFYFNVTEAIPENTILNFELDVTNLSPSSADTCFFSQTLSVNLNPSNPLGQNALKIETLNVYPNPTSTMAYVSLPKRQQAWGIEVFSASGMLVDTIAANGTAMLNLHAYSAGIYMIRASNGGEYVQSRLVKN